MKSLRIVFLFSFLVILLTDGRGQDTWSLERCVRHAWEHSLRVKNAELNVSFSDVDLKQSRETRYPSLNAQAGTGLNFGRVINPATNNFETENSLFSSIGVQTGMVLSQGGYINALIRQAGVNLDAANQDLTQIKNTLALEVALAYLNVLFAEENLVNAQATLSLTQAQLTQMDKMISAGTRPSADRYDIVAQSALDEQSIVTFENNREINFLTLKQLLNLEPDYPMQLEKPAISIEGMEAYENYTLATVYDAALTTQAQIEAQNLRIQSAQLGEQLARSNLYPSLSVGASIGTNYSDLDKRILGFQTIRVPQPGVFINNEPAVFEVEQAFPTGTETTPLLDQLDNNLGYGVSLSLNIPIYNNRQVRSAIDRARLTTIQQQNSSEQVRQTLKSDIQNALAAARAAKEALDASERAFEAAQIAYDNADRKFTLGTINNYDLTSAQNRLDAARVNRTIAKYDYLFRAKVIEYYLGRGLTLD